MPLGGGAAAPAGFLEMCERTPTECLTTVLPTDQMLADVRAEAARARWAAVFQNAGLTTAPAAIIRVAGTGPAPETSPAPSRAARTAKAKTPDQIRAAKDALRKSPRAGKDRDAPAPGIPPAASAVEAPPPVAAPSRPVARISTEALEAVTRRINRAVRRASDADVFGREDVWILPGGRRPSGDCEDYVLAKRRVLIDQGVDPAALSIAVVRTRRGETHAVLLVATPEGELVLDNLSPRVLPWREAPYEWLQRQAPGQPMVWVDAAA